MVLEDGNAEKFLSVMFNLNNAIKSESEYCCKICGNLNEKELFIIAFIGEKRSVKMSDIADYIQAPLSTLTTIVDKLVTNKFLLRYNSNDDRRVVKVELDRKGKASYKEFQNRREIVAKKVLGHLTEVEKVTLIANLAQLASSIQL
ncbi:DNA-binding transcriptional regulator, MarR family [Mucilaginibacter pineti]|uniref:DNA-binding transcriptional regulator, MarR family n=1 Tax=Mucilaginibacter pineti TaxID=1391627 RepID=A0A1G6Z904_9SPHI|nr:MarR family transcriptional regulator [Mucilaginibacter pineti]SDD99070.1 DNA-binding transcriptional regulator, MarR family [Mucilaginibacter pineti]